MPPPGVLLPPRHAAADSNQENYSVIPLNYGLIQTGQMEDDCPQGFLLFKLKLRGRILLPASHWYSIICSLI